MRINAQQMNEINNLALNATPNQIKGLTQAERKTLIKINEALKKQHTQVDLKDISDISILRTKLTGPETNSRHRSSLIKKIWKGFLNALHIRIGSAQLKTQINNPPPPPINPPPPRERLRVPVPPLSRSHAVLRLHDTFYSKEDQQVLGKNGFVIKKISPNQIQIDVVRDRIKHKPEEQLAQILDLMRDACDTSFHVTFYNQRLEQEKGRDGGGLTSDYVSILSEELLKKNPANFSPVGETSLILPKTQAKMSVDGKPPQMSDQEKKLFENLGKLMGYCHMSKRASIGKQFHNALFHATFSLSKEEVNTPFEQLTLATQIKICKALFLGLKNEGYDNKFLEEALALHERFENPNEGDFEKIATTLAFAGLLPDKWIAEDGVSPDLSKIEKNEDNKKLLKQKLTTFILTQPGGERQFGLQLAPIHAIAKGIRALVPGHVHLDPDMFSIKVQGILDRESVANYFQVGIIANTDQEITKKVGWLKEWIRNEATEDELKRLLIYCTGNSSVIAGRNITVGKQGGPHYVPVPKVSTCAFEIWLAPVPSQIENLNDHTKDNFIASLKEIALKKAPVFDEY